MAILHGSWLLEHEKSGLFIWGETWRKIGAIDIVESEISPQHPLAMTEAELNTFLNSLQQSGKLHWQLPETAEIKQKTKKTRSSSKTTAAALPTEILSIQRQVRAIALPTKISESNSTIMPQHSAAALEEPAPIDEIYLYPWQVEGYLLN
ncbi:MAG: ATP-dependent helicase, partial [Microcoleus sp.]